MDHTVMVRMDLQVGQKVYQHLEKTSLVNSSVDESNKISIYF